MPKETTINWTYSPSPESKDQTHIKAKYELFINGKFAKPESKKYFHSFNPADEMPLTQVARASQKDVDLAVKSAAAAYNKVWNKLEGKERGKYLFRIARMIQERAKELAVAESMDTGKPIRESRDFDVPAAANHFFYYAGWADKLEYAFPNRKVESLGVVGQIIPWNFPLLMAAWKIAPALATGNTVVLKPAETTSLSALKLAEIIKDCDLPPGVVNIVTGFGDTGEYLVKHPLVKKIAFTGSTEIGKHIQKLCAGTDKKLSLELGGKAAHIILEDASINEAIEGIINGIFFNQGEVCCAGSRLLVQENKAQEVITKLKARMEKLIVGDPLDKNTDIGAINSKNQLDKIRGYIEIAKQEGLEVHQSSCALPSKGFYVRPTLLLNASQSNRVVQEEIFGPVLTVQTFRTIEEAIELANNIPYGLSAGVWSSKGARIFNLSSKLKAGVIWANSYNKFDPASPFGGYKESGFGREGGLHGLYAYVDLK
jgi:aldehyde dehydrogenase (NAD+)